MVKKEWREVGAGEIWRDRDPRMWGGNRRVRVISADKSGAVVYQQVLGLDNERAVGRQFKSYYDRFRRAFEFVSAS